MQESVDEWFLYKMVPPFYKIVYFFSSIGGKLGKYDIGENPSFETFIEDLQIDI